MLDFGWAELEQDEIKASNKGHIKWSIKNGSIVRAGQLMAISSLNPSSPPSTSTTTISTTSSLNKTPDGLHGNGSGGENGSIGALDQSEPAKPRIIRARRINRKVKPIAASTLSTTTPTTTTLSSNSTTNSKNADDANSIDVDIDIDATANDINTSKGGSSFLGQYLKSAINTHRTASDSKLSQNKANTTSKTASTNTKTSSSTVPSQYSINSNSNSNTNTVSSTKPNHTEIRAHLDGFLRIYLTPQCRKDPNNNHELVYVLGKIEKCAHPAIIDGLCAVCGQPVNSDSSTAIPSPESNDNMAPNSALTSTLAKHPHNNNRNSVDDEHARDSFTLVGGVTISISSEYAKTYSTDTFQSLRTAKKLNLVLDLDHTLLHATADQRASGWIGKSEDVHTLLLPLMEGHPLQQQQQQGGGSKLNWLQPHYVKLRPYLAEFLCGIMDQYEVSIYTAGTRMYAEKIADLISRHVADHQRKLNSKEIGSAAGDDGGSDGSDIGNTVDKCLDEGHLLMLRENVARTRDHVSWCKSRKDRQDFVAKMNTQFQLQQTEDENLKKIAAEVDTSDADDVPHMLAGSEEDEGLMPKANGKKRKRVTFSLPVKDEHDSNINGNNNGNDKTVQLAKDTNEDDDTEFENISQTLKVLEEDLGRAEKKEVEALHIRKKIFGSRIISRTDVGDLGRDVKSLKRVFPCGGTMAAIVDDREDVWANATNNSTGMKGEPPDNLIFVRPYHWAPFQKFADVNNSAGEDITLQSESIKEENIISPDESNERQLLWTTDILTRIHGRYYDLTLTEEQRDKLTVPGILKQMRKEVFSNVGTPTKFILSGLVPLHKQRATEDFSNSPRPLIIRYAEELGAKIENEVTSDLTHVIAARDGTDKILRARRIPGCAVVKVNWLMECYWSCTLIDIDTHVLGPKPLQAVQLVPGVKRSILLMESDSSEEDDDGFFDDFEKEMEE